MLFNSARISLIFFLYKSAIPLASRSTIYVDYKYVTYHINICAISTEDKYDNNVKIFYEKSSVALIACDLSNPNSSYTILNGIIKINNFSPEKTKKIIVGINDKNKNRKVDYETVNYFAQTNNFSYFELNDKFIDIYYDMITKMLTNT